MFKPVNVIYGIFRLWQPKRYLFNDLMIMKKNMKGNRIDFWSFNNHSFGWKYCNGLPKHYQNENWANVLKTVSVD
jgi:hypothetical protein